MRYTHSSHRYRPLMVKAFSDIRLARCSKRSRGLLHRGREGHDTFIVSRRIPRVYYVLSGSGIFTIDDCKYDVSSGMLVEVPPKVEYSYSGKMKLVGFCTPRWFYGNDRHTKWNPDVVHEDLPIMANAQSWKIFAKRLINFYLWLNGKLWEKLPYRLAK